MNPHLFRRIALCGLGEAPLPGRAGALTYPPGFNLVKVPAPLAATNPEYPLVSMRKPP
jgi:hypothetical protein